MKNVPIIQHLSTSLFFHLYLVLSHYHCSLFQVSCNMHAWFHPPSGLCALYSHTSHRVVLSQDSVLIIQHLSTDSFFHLYLVLSYPIIIVHYSRYLVTCMHGYISQVDCVPFTPIHHIGFSSHRTQWSPTMGYAFPRYYTHHHLMYCNVPQSYMVPILELEHFQLVF